MATFGTFVSGQVLTAAELNGAGAWQDYTPTWTQSATITKTVNWARYTQLNKLVIVSIKMTASSAGTASNAIKIGLPVNASSNNHLMGTAIYTSTTPINQPLFAIYDSTSTVVFLPTAAADTPTDYLGTSGYAVAITVASGAIMYMNLTYEAA